MKQGLASIAHKALAQLHIVNTSLRLRWARLRNKKIVLLLGAPTHRNIGDLAIAYAETSFINSISPKFETISVTFETIMENKSDILNRLVKPGDVLVGIGGGNMGDMYLREELCRRKFIQGFPNNKIVIFPQTIHYSDTPLGRKELQKTTAIYAKHKDLTLIAREKTSHAEMLRVFPKNKVLFTPDIVLSKNSSLQTQPRSGVLLCLRDDLEAKIDEKDKKMIADFAKKHFDSTRYTDTISDAPLFPYRSKNGIVKAKLNEFSGAKLVITDRLHGMVFSAITGTPCVALASFNHKVTNTYEWIKHLPYITFCTDPAKLAAVVKQIDLDKTYHYTPADFDKYWAEIKGAITDGV